MGSTPTARSSTFLDRRTYLDSIDNGAAMGVAPFVMGSGRPTVRVPGDTIPGNGNYDLPIETVATDQIRVH
jgi:hypothetical protein